MDVTNIQRRVDEEDQTEELNDLVGWLFLVKRPFETVFQSISGRLPGRGRKRRKDRGE